MTVRWPLPICVATWFAIAFALWCGIVALLIGIAGIAGCATAPQERYPWHGPITDPDGRPARIPSYSAVPPASPIRANPLPPKTVNGEP
jgi:hypothetical protein